MYKREGWGRGGELNTLQRQPGSKYYTSEGKNPSWLTVTNLLGHSIRTGCRVTWVSPDWPIVRSEFCSSRCKTCCLLNNVGSGSCCLCCFKAIKEGAVYKVARCCLPCVLWQVGQNFMETPASLQDRLVLTGCYVFNLLWV